MIISLRGQCRCLCSKGREIFLPGALCVRFKWRGTLLLPFQMNALVSKTVCPETRLEQEVFPSIEHVAVSSRSWHKFCNVLSSAGQIGVNGGPSSVLSLGVRFTALIIGLHRHG